MDPETPLLYVLRDELGLKGPKFGCGLEQCNACKVLLDGADVPSCQLPVQQALGMAITTVEGLGTADELHPLQEAFLMEQAGQCGYCTAGMIMAAQGLLNRTRYPNDEEIKAALADNLCRCGTHERVRRAIKLRIGRPEWAADLHDDRGGGSGRRRGRNLRGSLAQNPELDAWIRINTDETITLLCGKAEIGQGIKTAVRQVAAEELDVRPERITVVMADTGRTPNEGITAGSMSMQNSGVAIRLAAAQARQIMLALAFEHLEAQTPADQLHGRGRDDHRPGQRASGDLLGTDGRASASARLISDQVRLKAPQDYRVVGQPEPRIDLLAKVTGGATYVHDLDLPGMCHARVLRPPNYQARLEFTGRRGGASDGGGD